MNRRSNRTIVLLSQLVLVSKGECRCRRNAKSPFSNVTKINVILIKMQF